MHQAAVAKILSDRFWKYLKDLGVKCKSNSEKLRLCFK